MQGTATGEPEGFAFNQPVTATLPVAPLAGDEIPLWITSPANSEDYAVISQSTAAYDGDAGTLTATFSHFSVAAAAAALSRGPSITSTGELPSCCSVTPTPDGCCCRTVRVTSAEGDTSTSACDCELLGQELTVEFPTCPGAPVQTVSESHASANCPADLQPVIEPAELTLWNCESRTFEARISGTAQDGSTCSLPLPFGVPASSDDAVATVTAGAINTGTVTGVSGGTASIALPSIVGGQFGATLAVDVVSLSGSWLLSLSGQELCTESGGEPDLTFDSGQGPVNLAVSDCATVAVDLGVPGAAPLDGPLTFTGDDAFPFNFDVAAPNPQTTPACAIFNQTNGQAAFFGNPQCPLVSTCQALSCSETISATVAIGSAVSSSGQGTASWDYDATVRFIFNDDDFTDIATTCSGGASLVLTRQ